MALTCVLLRAGGSQAACPTDRKALRPLGITTLATLVVRGGTKALAHALQQETRGIREGEVEEEICPAGMSMKTAMGMTIKNQWEGTPEESRCHRAGCYRK